MTWPTAALADIGSWFGGGTPSKSRSDFWVEGKIPWLSPKDMGAEVLSGTRDHITTAAVAESPMRLVPPNSVALVVRSGILERKLPVAIVPFATTLNQDMKAVVPRPDVDARWVAWGLRAAERRLLNQARKRGTTVASLEFKRLQAFRLPTPPLVEQRLIVDLLDDYLFRLSAAASTIGLAEKRMQAMRRRLLANCYDGSPTPLGDLAESSGYGTSTKCVVDGPGPAVVRIPNLVNGQVDLTDEKRAADDAVPLSGYALRQGDLLIVRTNGSVDLIGRSAVVQSGVDAAFASYLIRYRVDRNRVRPAWVQAMLEAPRGRADIERRAASSAGQHNLSLAKLNSLIIPVPSLQEQDRRLAWLTAMSDDLARLVTSSTAARQREVLLRRSLLQAAFSGQLTGRSSDLERAEELVDA